MLRAHFNAKGTIMTRWHLPAVLATALLCAAWTVAEDSTASKPADNGVKASGLVKVNGLEVAVMPAKAGFDKGEILKFKVTLTNTTDKDMDIGNTPLWECWQFVVTDKGGKEFCWVCNRARRILLQATVLAGKSMDVEADLTNLFSAVPVKAPRDKGPTTMPAPADTPKELPAGTYKLVITIDRSMQPAPEFSRKIVTKPVEFSIGQAATTTQASSDDGGGWVILVKNEKWYQQTPQKEQVFSGTLRLNPGDGKPSIRMRTAHYKLDNQDVYFKKSQTLDDLVGKKVEIRGKLVKIFRGNEIWPAEIRQVKEADATTKPE